MRQMSVHRKPRLRQLLALGVCLAAGSVANAQTLETGSASVSIGYGRVPGQESRPVVVSNYGVRDTSGNLVVIDGVIQNAQAQAYSASSASASASASASGTFTGGVGGSVTSSAIGNNLTVITQGDNNTVIVNSTQINNGKIIAGATATTTPPTTATTGGPLNAN
jgi:holdfast attachment protein HfaA